VHASEQDRWGTDLARIVHELAWCECFPVGVDGRVGDDTLGGISWSHRVDVRLVSVVGQAHDARQYGLLVRPVCVVEEAGSPTLLVGGLLCRAVGPARRPTIA